MSSPTITQLAADNIRVLSVAMVEKAKSGHPGGPMGGADFIHILYSEFLSYDPDDLHWQFRDRFFLDPGHLSAMLYAELALCGILSMEDIKGFRQYGTLTPGHPERDLDHGIENSSGPLGAGHAMAAGSAIAERFFVQRFGDWASHKTYTYISDGGIQEEISQGVGRIAGHLGLANLIMFFDSNSIQLSHPTNAATSENTKAKYEAWGWRVEEIDGHDADQIRNALKRAQQEKDKPTLIIGKTIIGKGGIGEDGAVFEGKSSMHGSLLSKIGVSVSKTISNLHGNPDDPFRIYPEVAKLYKTALDQKRAAAKERKKKQAEWAAINPEKAAQLEKMFKGDIPAIDFAKIAVKPTVSTREASGEVLARCAETIPNMVVCSADLSNSDHTDYFLKKSTYFKKNDFSGRFLHAGVSELTMSAIAVGMGLYGGIIPACGTFFVFSDYMKPIARLAALMGVPVIFIWTHDSFRVGEDGPTHQPIEQEAQIRLLEKLRNHHGSRGIMVMRPADAAETFAAWNMALINRKSPSALLLTRQAVAAVPPAGGDSRLVDAQQISRGAYIVLNREENKPDMILLANGSEVGLQIETASILQNKYGLKIRVVSAPSEGLFMDQPVEYQRAVLPPNISTFGVTAGLPVALRQLAGPFGEVFGLEHFGYSGPFQVLDKQFGFSPEIIAEKAIQYKERFTQMRKALMS